MLFVHRAERSDRLVAGLAELLAAPPADPFAPEVVAVPAKGVERWVAQRLSHVLGAARAGSDSPGSDAGGVCANVRFPHPAALVAEAVTAVTAVPPDRDPWAAPRLLWALLPVLDGCLDQPWARGLARHLGHGGDERDRPRPGRRLELASRLTRLYTAYGAARPALLRAWAAGDDVDGTGRRIDADLAWQAELWREVRTEIGSPAPAERLPEVCELLAADRGAVELPERLSLFGPTRLATDALNVLAAVARQRDVHLWLPHPSPVLWDRLAQVQPPGDGVVPRRDDPTRSAARSPLLASLGRDARELQHVLAVTAPDAVHRHLTSPARPATLLGRLQAALADDEPVPARTPAGPPDRSVQVHACHGPARQVEVLREVLVGLLADDPTLEPRDVLVMCPDIEDYAPLVSAFFGLDPEPGAAPGTSGPPAHHPGHLLRVRLADRSLRQTNPLLGVLGTVLALADSRLPASALVDLLSAGPVRRRFGFTDDDVATVEQWLVATGVRWGMDAGHREREGVGTLSAGTWQAGLDRILLGAAMSEDELDVLGPALPLDAVESTHVDLAGRLAELVERVAGLLARTEGRHRLDHWLRLLTDALDLLTAVGDADEWQDGQARRELAALADSAADRAARVQLDLADVRALLRDLLAGRPTRANFRTGHLTMCSLVPMRSVPHRVVCLLGLDDGRFPRSAGVDGDDLLARRPCVGERDPRSEDRQLLLDAVLAAGEHLVVLYTGADPRTNARRPAAVPVGELLDALDLLTPPDDPARQHVLVRHPLQPVDRRNFRPGALGPARPFSFDRLALNGAHRAAQPRRRHEPFAGVRLEPSAGDVALDDLVAFLTAPVRFFLTRRLGVTLAREERQLSDRLDLTLDPLSAWQVGDRVLRARLSGRSPAVCKRAEWRRGLLPPGQFGVRLVEATCAAVEPVVQLALPLRSAAAEQFDVDVPVGSAALTGTVAGVRGGRLVSVDWASLGPRHRMAAWVRLLALSAARPGSGWTAVTIGRGSDGPAVSYLDAVDGQRATDVLQALVDLYRRGTVAPLPLPPKSAAAYAAKRPAMNPPNAAAAARSRWDDSRNVPGERADAACVEVWGTDAPFDRVLREPPAPDEALWFPDEPTRFGVLARRLWQPLLEVERDALPAAVRSGLPVEQPPAIPPAAP